MNPARAFYLLVPSVLIVAWATFYLPWSRRHPAEDRLRIEDLPPAVLVWPEAKPRPEPPDIAARRRELEELQAQLIARLKQESAERFDWSRRHGAGARATPGADSFP
jgi:hypothetical protein